MSAEKRKVASDLKFFFGITCTHESCTVTPRTCIKEVNRVSFMLTLSLTAVICLNNSAFLFSDLQLNKHIIRLQRRNFSIELQSWSEKEM